MTNYDAINATIQALGLLVSTTALALLVWQLRLLRQQVNDAAEEAKERYQRSQRRETLAFIADTMISVP
jgi:protein-S-isoprenylcysteine O-methyltransferase Ste14